MRVQNFRKSERLLVKKIIRKTNEYADTKKYNSLGKSWIVR